MRIRRLLAATVLSVGALALFAPAASADVTACVSVSVTVNGEQVVNEAACQTVDTP